MMNADVGLMKQVQPTGYIHINPVNHGLVSRAVDWPHSTIHRFIKHGLLDENWATSVDDGDYGEGGCWA